MADLVAEDAGALEAGAVVELPLSPSTTIWCRVGRMRSDQLSMLRTVRLTLVLPLGLVATFAACSSGSSPSADRTYVRRAPRSSHGARVEGSAAHPAAEAGSEPSDHGTGSPSEGSLAGNQPSEHVTDHLASGVHPRRS